ncbi:LRR receptor-like serine/threonine-protein kinase ERL1 [Camellia lanceoleosa]|uniref:LRR receptor-like serine/threonine-protein kinase ERL1 n=1 Tax=Camellia lanceoleosa TaxID=1840588 RepID=A0ACC0GL54_9ERIC|nr:LRR receptor-like serine/threonine-protein kinase ERL1 [Camellia lanceoleosa]
MFDSDSSIPGVTIATSEKNLSNLNLGGEISPAIGDLKNLQSMDFQGNKLTGQIPDEIGNCVSLMLGILPRILINYNSHVLNHALSGIAVSMGMKYADNIDNIVKEFEEQSIG